MYQLTFNLKSAFLFFLSIYFIPQLLGSNPPLKVSNTVGDPLEIESFTVVNASCNGSSNGSISITVIGGIGNYSINWSNGAFDVLQITNLPAGNYGVTVTDDQPESVEMSFTVTQPAAVQVNLISQTNITCANPQANIQVNATGGNGGFSYNWTGGFSGSNINVPSAGTYTVTATDVNNCTGTLQVNVTENTTTPTISAGPNQSIACSGGTTTLQGTGPIGGQFNIQWTTSGGNIVSGANTYTPTVNQGGTYTLTVINNTNGCQSQSNTSVTGPPSPISITLTPQNVSCSGAGDGQITSQVAGGNGNYMYSWSNMATTPNISNLNPGTYTVTVSDGNGCTATSSANITQPTALNVNVSTTDQTQVGINNGSATANPSGGTGSYNYAWNTGGTTQSISNLSPGTYTVTVTDANGCTALASGVVDAITCTLSAGISISGNISCFGGSNGSLLANPQNAQGSPTFLWSTGATSQQISNLGAGSYQLTISDGVGCTATASIDLTQPTQVNTTVTATQMTGVGNNDGSVSSSTTGGTGSYNYLWSNGSTSQNINNLGPGTYTVTVTDANGCTDTGSATINQITCNIAVNLTIATPLLCNGDQNGAINAQVAGNSGTILYNWSNGSTTSNLNNLPAGNYALTVTDALNCTATASIALTQPTAVNASVSTTNQTTAGVNNGSATANASGGTGNYTYLWNTGSTTQTINNLAPGTYTVTVTDQNGCTDVATGIVSALDCNFTASITVVNEIDCFGNNNGILAANTAGGSGNITYQWSNGATTQQINNLSPGNYIVTATDANNCMATSSQILIEPSPLNVNLQITQMTSVNGNDGSITAIPSGGTPIYSYAWSTGSVDPVIDNLSPGSYTVTVTDQNGCITLASGDINTINCTLDVSLTITNNILCFGDMTGAIGSQIINGQGNISYSWSTGSTGSSISGLAAGDYALTVTDDLGCSASDNISLSQPAQLGGNLQITQMTGPQANNGIVQIIPQGGTPNYSFLWSTGSTQNAINGLAPGTYSVTVTDANGCQASFSGTINPIICELQATIALNANITCFNAQNGSLIGTQTGGEMPVEYLWSNGSTSQSINNLGPGAYSLTITDNKGCTSSASFQLTSPQQLSIQLTTTGLSADGANDGMISSTVSGGTMPYNYLWNTGATTSSISGLAPGTYSLTVSDINGCTRVANTTINPFDCNLGAQIQINEIIQCFGDNTGSITAIPVNGVEPFTFAWSNGATEATLTNLSAGIYEVTISGGNNCEAIAEVEIMQPQDIFFQLQISPLTGPNSNDAGISVTATGGTGNLLFTWSNGETNPNIDNLSAGQYCLTITDQNGCFKDTCALIQEFDCNLVIAEITTSDVSCFGGNDGSVEISATGGLAPYTFSLSPDLPLNQLIAGVYVVTVADDRDCSVADTFAINQPAELKITVSDFSATINEENTGFINIDVQGGTEPYQINWTLDGFEFEVEDSTMLVDLSSGIYQVEVIDSNGCIDLIDIIINLQVSTSGALLENSLVLAPNPAKETIMISLKQVELQTSESYFIRIFDLNGNIVHGAPLTGLIKGHNIDISNLVSGLYLLQIQMGEEVATKRFIKQ